MNVKLSILERIAILKTCIGLMDWSASSHYVLDRNPRKAVPKSQRVELDDFSFGNRDGRRHERQQILFQVAIQSQ